MEFRVKLTGTKPMLQHNGRLANPVDLYTKRLKQLTSKRKKTEEDLVAIMQVEARGGCWETTDHKLGLPTAAVWRSIHESAKMDKLGKTIERGLSYEDSCQPILVNGIEQKCDDFVADPTRIDYRSVKIGTSRTMRARPLIPAGWESVHTMELMTDLLDFESLIPLIHRAGKLYGVGDWRPIYGTYEAEVLR